MCSWVKRYIIHISFIIKVWYEMEYILKENHRLMNGDDNDSVRSGSVFGGNEDAISFISDNESHFSDEFVTNRRPSVEIELGNMGKSGEKGIHVPEVKPLTTQRKQWLCCVWGVSWWIPASCLSTCGGMKMKDRQLAWYASFIYNEIYIGEKSWRYFLSSLC